VPGQCVVFETGDGTAYTFLDGLLVMGAPPCPVPVCAAPTGEWLPPPREGDRRRWTVVHTYRTAGAFTVRVQARSEAATCRSHPYTDSFDVSYLVAVAPPPLLGS
jgi:hypothetical protein